MPYILIAALGLIALALDWYANLRKAPTSSDVIWEDPVKAREGIDWCEAQWQAEREEDERNG